MRQFILPASWTGEPVLNLSGRDYHYLNRVLRLGEGDEFPARDVQGGAWICRIHSVGDTSLELELQAAAVPPNSAGPRISLIMGIPKGKKMDQIIRQTTEAGVARIIPLLCEHSVVRLDQAEGVRKQERWNRVAKEALQQSGTAKPPEITTPVEVSRLPELTAEADGVLVCHEKATDARPMHELLAGFASRAPAEEILRISLLVGPEGGFSPGELELFSSFHYDSVYLGASVLRAETAAVYAVAAVQTILRESGAWQLKSPEHGV